MTHNEKIIDLINIKQFQEAKQLFAYYITRISQMNNIVYMAFNNNQDDIGKEIIKFNFIINNQGYKYNYSPFDFFCYVCKNEYLDILFRIIEDSYFWTKDKVIFEPEFEQTPRQWLIATASYIMCTLNKINSLEILCDKYKITKFDAEQTKFFEVANKNNFGELFNFLVNRYGYNDYITEEQNAICETSLYYIPELYKKNNSLDNPMYIQSNPVNNSIDNPMYMQNQKKPRMPIFDKTI
jgi:hypothetical protein